jgi:tetratricopeptide (TPR) repeat protein
LSRSVFVVLVLDEKGDPAAQGSAVAVGSNELVTNKHVVAEGPRFLIKQGDKSWPATVLQLSPSFDLCLLSVVGLETASPPDMRSLKSVAIGERVYAIGAPQGLELTLSDGLVSGIRHDSSGPVIQTTAAISAGSSGGGLFDAEGGLVGITSFFLKGSQQLNFAIPADAIANLRTQPRSATARAWVSLGDQIMAEAAVPEIAGPVPLGDFAAQQAYVRDFEAKLAPVRIQWRKAARAYEEALRITEDDAETWLKLGTTYATLRERAEAADALRRATAIRPDDKSIWVQAGDTYKKMDATDEAVDAYKRAVSMDVSDASLWAELAGAYPRSKRNDAIQAMKHAETLKPSDAAVWWRMGLLYENRLDRRGDAERCFEEAARIAPREKMYLFSLGQLYVLEHKKSKVRQVYEALKSLDPELAEELIR